MSFDTGVFAPKALKGGNAKGVKVMFKTKNDGHEFSGNLNHGGAGSMNYAGKWFGFDVTDAMNTKGEHTVNLKRGQAVAGQDINFNMGWKSSGDCQLSGDLSLGANTTFTKQLRGANHNVTLKNTVKMGVNMCGMDFSYKGISTELSYMNDSGSFGTFLKMASNTENLFFLEQAGYMQKLGTHTFAVNSQWEAPPKPKKKKQGKVPDQSELEEVKEDGNVEGGNDAPAPAEDAAPVGSKYGFKSLTITGQTKVSDNWNVAMSLQPSMTMNDFKQDGQCSIGVQGTLDDNLSVKAVVSNGESANVTATYKPNSNVDFSMTNTWDLNDISQNGLTMGQLKPAFTINLHD